MAAVSGSELEHQSQCVYRTGKAVWDDPEKKIFHPGDVKFSAPFGGNSLDGSGGFGGGTFGYNWQGGSNCCFVYGIEVDLGFADTGGNDRTFAIVDDRGRNRRSYV